jgi:hypothetical protein
LLGQCALALAAFAAYCAFSWYLQTDSAKRSSAPPLYAWWKVPRAHGVADVLRWFPPLAMFLAWRWAMTGRRGAPKLPDRWLLPLLPVAVILMNVAIAASDGGLHELVRPFDAPGVEFYDDVHLVHGVRQFLHDHLWLHNRNAMSLHGNTHPPGPILFLYLVSKWIGPGLRAAALAAIVVSALTIIPAHLLARRLFGPRVAAITSGLYVVAPSLVLFGATSMDGVYTLPLVFSLYAFVRAIDARTGLSTCVWALITAAALAVGMLMTFSAVCVGVLLAMYGAASFSGPRRGRVWGVLLLAGGAFVLAFIALKLGTGYDLIASVKASMASDEAVMGERRRALLPYLDVSTANLLAFLIGCGITISLVAAKGIKDSLIACDPRRWKLDRFAPLLPCFAAAVVLLSFSTLYRWETERIWTFLCPLAVIAAAKSIADVNDPAEGRRLLDVCLCGSFLQTYLMQLFLFSLW